MRWFMNIDVQNVRFRTLIVRSAATCGNSASRNPLAEDYPCRRAYRQPRLTQWTWGNGPACRTASRGHNHHHGDPFAARRQLCRPHSQPLRWRGGVAGGDVIKRVWRWLFQYCHWHESRGSDKYCHTLLVCNPTLIPICTRCESYVKSFRYRLHIEFISSLYRIHIEFTIEEQ